MVLSDPWSSGINITNITGVGPEKAEVSSSTFALLNGSRWTHSRQPYRNIVFTIRYMDSCSSVEEVRMKTYKFFRNQDTIRLTFKTTIRTLVIDGVVESNIPTIFAKESGAQISILCMTPYYRFPEALTYSIPDENNLLFEYPGEEEAGVVIRLLWNQYSAAAYAIDQIELELVRHLIAYDQTERISFTGLQAAIGRPFAYNDMVELSTIPGDKHCILIGNDGLVKNLLEQLSFTNSWTKLYPIPSNIVGDEDTGKYSFIDVSSQNVRFLIDVSISFEALFNGL